VLRIVVPYGIVPYSAEKYVNYMYTFSCVHM